MKSTEMSLTALLEERNVNLNIVQGYINGITKKNILKKSPENQVFHKGRVSGYSDIVDTADLYSSIVNKCSLLNGNLKNAQVLDISFEINENTTLNLINSCLEEIALILYTDDNVKLKTTLSTYIDNSLNKNEVRYKLIFVGIP